MNVDSSNYPVSHSIAVGTEVIDLAAMKSADGRMLDFLAATLGFDADGNFNSTEDPFLRDLAVVVGQHSIALAAVEAIASGRMSSTDAEPKYTGGDAERGSLIFTPQQSAKMAWEQIQDKE